MPHSLINDGHIIDNGVERPASLITAEPLNEKKSGETLHWSDFNHKSEYSAVPFERNNHKSRNTRSHGEISMQYSCLLIPVFLAAWWYWFRRKARSVVSKLLHHSHQETEGEEDELPDDLSDGFSTWDEVVESQDPSARFVKWIKASDYQSTDRRRAQVKQSSRRTLRLLTRRSDLSDGFLDEGSVKSQQHQQRQSIWQCLDDVHGIELCTVDSEAATDYEEMTVLRGQHPCV